MSSNRNDGYSPKNPNRQLSTVPPAKPTAAKPANSQAGAKPEEEKIAINGFQQILDMLRVADPEFRESLLRRLAARDKTLAHNLRRELS